MTLVSLFAALTAISAYIYIPLPFSPVPVTLQLLIAFLAGGLLGSKLGFLSQLIYLLLGAIGLPIFAGGTGGIGILFGPTTGYIFGFLPAAYLAGLGKKKYIPKIFCLFSALAVLYLLGVTGLILVADMNLSGALSAGVIPFIIGDLMKIFLAGYLIVKIPTDKII